MTIVVGAMAAKAKAKAKAKAEEKEKGKVEREGLPHLTRAVVHRTKTKAAVADLHLQVEGLRLLLLLASEESLLQVKLTDLLALDS